MGFMSLESPKPPEGFRLWLRRTAEHLAGQIGAAAVS